MILKHAAIDIASGTGTADIIAAVTGKRLRIRSLYLTVGTAGDVTFQNGANAVSGALSLAASTVHEFRADSEGHFPDSAENEAFVINRAGTTTVSGFVTYWEL